jgi:hypothetical protein
MLAKYGVGIKHYARRTGGVSEGTLRLTLFLPPVSHPWWPPTHHPTRT